jgi:hypothetical protein
MAYDKDGNYILSKQDKLNEKAKKENKAFVKRMEKFLIKHNINGTAYTYGFATTNPTLASEKLKKLKIKFKLDKSPNFHTKVIIGKTEL